MLVLFLMLLLTLTAGSVLDVFLEISRREARLHHDNMRLFLLKIMLNWLVTLDLNENLTLTGLIFSVLVKAHRVVSH